MGKPAASFSSLQGRTQCPDISDISVTGTWWDCFLVNSYWEALNEKSQQKATALSHSPARAELCSSVNCLALLGLQLGLLLGPLFSPYPPTPVQWDQCCYIQDVGGVRLFSQIPLFRGIPQNLPQSRVGAIHSSGFFWREAMSRSARRCGTVVACGLNENCWDQGVGLAP